MASQESRLIISIDARNAQNTARELSRELQNITNSGSSADRQVGVLGGSLRNLAGYMAGIVSVGAAINKMDAYTGLQNRLKLVTDSQSELNTAMGDTFKIAQNTASSWDSVAMVYQRFADNADRLNITMEKTAALTETVSKAISVSGGSAASAEAALMQFGQALASGVLRGEEFNSIAEQAPGLLKAIAFGLDTNVGSLRAMAAEGKITGDVLVEALSKAQPYIDDLFNKTDFTIAQSFTKLSNEITKFVGEAGSGSGAAKALSESISGLANNLSTIADIAVVGGVALLTKAILTQTVAIYGSITASVARRSTLLAELAVQAAASTAEVARTGAIAQLTAMQLVDAKAAATRMTGIQRLAYVQATVIPLEAKATQAVATHTATTAADTVVQNANNAARSRGAMLLGLVGGPIGAITIGVAALAAGYMYLKSRTAEANAKLEEQGKVAEKTNEELLKLTGNDKKSAIVDLTAAFNAQNAELLKSKEAVDAVLFAIRASSVENEKARKVTEDAKNGTISYTKAVELLNKMDISPELYNMLKKTALQYDENSNKAINSQKKLSILGFEFTLTGNKAQDSENKIRNTNAAIDDTARAANAAAKALQDYRTKAQTQAFDDIYSTGLMSQGYTPAQSKAILDLQNAKGTSAILTKEEIAQALQNLKLTEQNSAAEKRYADGISNRAKAQSDATRKAEQAQKEAAREAEQRQKEADQSAKEMADLRYELAYDFSNREVQLQYDLEKKKDDIRKAFANDPATMNKYIQWAELRNKAESELYKSELAVQLYSFRMSEEEKLNAWRATEAKKIGLIKESFAGEKDTRRKALKEQFDYELSFLKLAKEQRIFAAQESMMTEMEAVRARYDLERKEIANIRDEKERSAIQEAKDKAYINLGVATGGSMLGSVQSRSDGFGMSQTDTLNAEYIKQNEEMNLRYAQQQEAAQNNAMALLAIEQEYLLAKGRLNTEYDEKLVVSREIDHENQLQYYGNMLAITQSTFGQMTSLVKDSQGENSSAYKTMFVMQQAMAIASALVSTHLAAAQVMADPTALTLAQKTTYSSLILAAGYANAGMIAAQTIAGFKTGGYTGSGGTSDVAGVVHGQEYVLNAAATKRVGTGTLDAINSGGSLGGEISVNIQNYGTSKQFDVQQIDANTVRIIARDEARTAITSDLQNPNSAVSKGIKNNFNTSNRRG